MLKEIFIRVKRKGLKTVCKIDTESGVYNIVLYTNKVPRTCYSFLKLFTNNESSIEFTEILTDRLLITETLKDKDKITLDNHSKLSLNKKGLLTISKDLNTKLGITLSACEVYDMDYIVFGEIDDNSLTIPSHNKSKKPLLSFKALTVIDNAFSAICQEIRKELADSQNQLEKQGNTIKPN